MNALVVCCAWCARYLTAAGWKVLDVPPTGLKSHGICPECEAAYFPELAEQVA